MALWWSTFPRGGRSTRRFVVAASVLLWTLFSWAARTATAEPSLAELEAKLRQMFSPPPLWDEWSPWEKTRAHDAHAIVRKEWLVLKDASGGPNSFPRSTRLAAMPSNLLRVARASVRVITPFQQGAGFLVSPNGDVVTSYHTLLGAKSIMVQTVDGRLHDVEGVKAFSALHDLAILKIRGDDFEHLPLQQASTALGPTPVRLLGHPRGEFWSVATGRVLRVRVEQGVPVLHVDTESKKGASGGPILTPEGTVCGVVAYAATLADGSRVTVGIAAEAVRSLLAVREPLMPLDTFWARQRHIQATAFFSLLLHVSRSTANAMEERLSCIRLVAASSPRRTVVSVRQAGPVAAPAIQLLLLRTLAEEAIGFLDEESDAKAGAQHLLHALNGYLDCLRDVNRLHDCLPSDASPVIGRLLLQNQSARLALRAAAVAFAREFDRHPWPGGIRLTALRADEAT